MDTSIEAPTVTYLNVTELRIGDTFTHRGRTYRLSEYPHTWGCDRPRGEFGVFKAWSVDTGREVNLTVFERDC